MATSSFATILIFVLLILVCFPSKCYSLVQKEIDSGTSESPTKASEANCFNNIFMAEWWSYVWCHSSDMRQIHFNHHTQVIEHENHLGRFIPEESGATHHIYRSDEIECMNEETGLKSARYAEVTIECCRETGRSIPFPEMAAETGGTIIASVQEPVPCSYYFTVCSEEPCTTVKTERPVAMTTTQNSEKEVATTTNALGSPSTTRAESTKASEDVASLEGAAATAAASESVNMKPPTVGEAIQTRERIRSMFDHGYSSYMSHAFPEGDLNPLSCRGEPFDLIKIPLVTLIDSLDTLVIMGNHSEFRRAVSRVSEFYSSFDQDVNVSVFETTIRVMGGLLSAHLMAIDENIGIYDDEVYDGNLLLLAEDLGERLLPAFQTNTGIPYGTVNLRYGVPRGETEIASTAGAGSLVVEFGVLSSLTGKRKFGDAAYGAMKALFDRRSSIGLLGKHIHTDTGRWFESVSGIGSNSDSFYEYLLKAYLLFRRKELYGMFSDAYASIKKFVQVGDWFSDVDMFNGKLRRNRVENLHAFWPGMEATLGFSGRGARQLNSFYSVWTSLGYLPEEFDNVEWEKGKSSMHPYYPLRPELIESTYMQYRTTRDRSWLAAGLVFVDSLEQTRTPCGFASVSNMESMELADQMPSFFLSETLKYLYLLFDEDNFVHDRAYIFSTEAHPFDPMQLPEVVSNAWGTNLTTGSACATTEESAQTDDADEDEREESDDTSSGKSWREELMEVKAAAVQPAPLSPDMLPVQCSRRLWWDRANSFVRSYIVPIEEGQGDGSVSSPDSSSGASHPWQMLAVKANLVLGMINGISNGKEERKMLPDEMESHRDEQSSFERLAEAQYMHSRAIKQLERSSKMVRQLELRGFGLSPLASPHQASSEDDVDSMEKGDTDGSPVIASVGTGETGGLSTPSNANVRKKRRPLTCYPGDEPSPRDDRDGAPPPASLQTVSISMGPLGDFTVHVYSDGFIVKSRTDGDTIEISNVGQDIMFIRDSNQQGSAVVVGDQSGQVSACSVSVSHPSSSKSHVWSRSCSIAAFGGSDSPRQYLNYEFAQTKRTPVSSSGVATKPASSKSTEGYLTPSALGEVDVLCPDSTVESKSSVKGATNAESEKNHDKTSADSDAPPKQSRRSLLNTVARFLFGAPHSDGDHRVEEEVKVDDEKSWVSSKPLSGKIAISRRGDCMFEEKAALAEKAGADALVVINNQNSVFIMSGSASGEADATSEMPPDGDDHPSRLYGARTIPTVMLSSKDGEDLLQTLSKLREEHGKEADVTVEIQNKHMLLDSNLLGSNDYPKLRVRRNLIHVVGRGRWGCILTTKSGSDWQLFIQRKEDLNAVHMWPALVMGNMGNDGVGEVHTVTPALSYNPVEVYANAISRKCPTHLAALSDQVTVHPDGEEGSFAITARLSLGFRDRDRKVSQDGYSVLENKM